MTNPPEDPDLSGISSSLHGLTTSVDQLELSVRRDGDLRATKLHWIQRVLYVLVPAVLLLLILTGTNIFILHQNNQDALDRSRIATEQRKQQQEQLVQLNQQTVNTARCAITAKGNVSVYDACVAKIPPVVVK